MKTKIVYVLITSPSDTYYESALVSVFSVKYRIPHATITLLTDDKTDCYLKEHGKQLLQYISEIVVIGFSDELSQEIRSRLLKTNMRNYLSGSFLYIDCDTIVVDSLKEIDYNTSDIAAVLDGHSKLHDHPAKELFLKQNRHFNYPFNEIENYFNAGVIYSKDNQESIDFFSAWHRNYKDGLIKDISLDQPSFSKTNYDSKNVIQELPGEWNCQIRLGGMYLNTVKILHLVSKRNMPISFLGTKEYLLKIREKGLTEKNKDEIINYRSTFHSPIGIVVNSDLHFNFSKLYEQVRSIYLSKDESFLRNGLNIIEKLYEEGSYSRLDTFFYKMNKLLISIEIFLHKLFTRLNKN